MRITAQEAAAVKPHDPADRPADPATDEAALASGRTVLRAEALALLGLADGLGSAFAAAVARMAAIRGRVVVSGMGKSGHVGRKIAATFASTGTPALFVHPAEASHGDLGMVAKDDLVLALSNSGETTELRDLTLYTRRFGIPLVAVTKQAGSTLAEAADLVLLLPDAQEACPMGLAPTTSTTATLALGDALAVALLSRKGFSARDFSVFHPGGKLGAQLLRVEEIMHKGDDLPLIGSDAMLAEAILEMTKKRLGCVGIVDGGGRLAGILTDGDLRRHIGTAGLDRPVDGMMTHEPRTIEPRALAVEALALMNRHGISALFVLDGARPVGALHLHDCLRAGIV